MCNTLELSGLFVYVGGLNKFFSAWGDRKNCWVVVCWEDQYQDQFQSFPSYRMGYSRPIAAQKENVAFHEVSGLFCGTRI